MFYVENFGSVGCRNRLVPGLGYHLFEFGMVQPAGFEAEAFVLPVEWIAG
jgi:hypothetical protein